MSRLAATFAASLLLVSALGRDPAAAAQQPEVLTPFAPAYPPIARAARAVGEVVVEVEINADGSVASAKGVGGHPLLRRAAESAASRWRFRPDVRATSARLTFEFRWEAPGDEAAAPSPYHVVVVPPKPPDTEDRVPPDAEGRSCEVHGFKLERDKVRIAYGLPVLDPVGAEASGRLFPHANSWAGGGCVVTDDSPKFAEVLYCRACRAAEASWREQRGESPEDN
ncbi:MAG TPA: TonB family protein [Pyrinomonadaceae bacterium]|nr:TonB family protein [Pyrinomonadaceae bacterium]